MRLHHPYGRDSLSVPILDKFYGKASSVDIVDPPALHFHRSGSAKAARKATIRQVGDWTCLGFKERRENCQTVADRSIDRHARPRRRDKIGISQILIMSTTGIYLLCCAFTPRTTTTPSLATPVHTHSPPCTYLQSSPACPMKIRAPLIVVSFASIHMYMHNASSDVIYPIQLGIITSCTFQVYGNSMNL
jgi:hypothetical protein